MGLYPDPYLVLCNYPIPVKKKGYRVPWYFIPFKLTFVAHVKGLKKKCIKALYLLSAVSNTDLVGDRTVLLRLCRAFIQSKSDNGCFIYGAYYVNHIFL